MEAKNFFDDYKLAVLKAAQNFKLSDEKLASLKNDDKIDFSYALPTISGEEIEFGKFLQHYNDIVDSAFSVSDDFIAAIEPIIRRMPDDTVIEILKKYSEILSRGVEFSVSGYAPMAMTDVQFIESAFLRDAISKIASGHEAYKAMNEIIDMVRQTA